MTLLVLDVIVLIIATLFFCCLLYSLFQMATAEACDVTSDSASDVDSHDVEVQLHVPTALTLPRPRLRSCSDGVVTRRRPATC